jgi:hypothetical protein
MFRLVFWLTVTDVSKEPASYILKLKMMAEVPDELLVRIYQAVRRRIPEARHINIIRLFNDV